MDILNLTTQLVTYSAGLLNLTLCLVWMLRTRERFFTGTTVLFSFFTLAVFVSNVAYAATAYMASGLPGSFWLVAVLISVYFFYVALARNSTPGAANPARWLLPVIVASILAVYGFGAGFASGQDAGILSGVYGYPKNPLAEAAILATVMVYSAIRARAGSRSAADRRTASFLRTLWIVNSVCVLPILAVGMFRLETSRDLGPLSLDWYYAVLSLANFVVILRFRAPGDTKEKDHKLSPVADSGNIDKFDLSEREREIVDLLNRGLAGKEIAHRLNIQTSTVKNHIYNIYRKTGAKSRVELLNMSRGNPE